METTRIETKAKSTQSFKNSFEHSHSHSFSTRCYDVLTYSWHSQHMGCLTNSVLQVLQEVRLQYKKNKVHRYKRRSHTMLQCTILTYIHVYAKKDGRLPA